MAKVKKMAFGGMGKQPADALRQMGAAANAANAARQLSVAQAAAQKSKPAGQAAQTPMTQTRTTAMPYMQAGNMGRVAGTTTKPMPGGGPLQGLGAAMSGPKTGLGTAMGSVGPRPAGGMSDAAKTYAAAARASMNSTNSGTPKSGTGPKPGFGAAVKQMGLGTAMGMNKMAGAGAALGKSFGMKSGGAVGSASSRADGVATKGKTKGTMIKMKNGGKAC